MDLRWMQPAGSAPVDWYRVYRDDALAVDGVVGTQEDGIYATALPAWPDPAIYHMTSVNAAGESIASNTIALPEPQLAPLLFVLVAALCLWHRWRMVDRAGE
jgi:hypothetical protein